MLVRSCFLITLIKCLKGHKSLGSLCNVKSKSQWLTQWQGHLLSCCGQLIKTSCILSKPPSLTGLKIQIWKWFNHAGVQDLQINHFTMNLPHAAKFPATMKLLTYFCQRILLDFCLALSGYLLWKEFCLFLHLHWSSLKHLDLDRTGGDCARSWGFLWSGKCVCEREYVKRWGLIEGCKNWTVLFEVYLPSDANEDMMTKTTCVQAASKLKPEANGARVVAERENPGGRKSGKFDTRKVKKGNQGKGDKRESF